MNKLQIGECYLRQSLILLKNIIVYVYRLEYNL
jgi:hypothetical protein